VFALIMLLLDMRRERGDLGIQEEGPESHPGDALENQAVFHRIPGILPPGKWRVSRNEHSRSILRAQPGEPFDDQLPRFAFVTRLDFFLGKKAGDRHGAVEMIGMRRSQAGNFTARLGEHA
jgi:hypothetical protein